MKRDYSNLYTWHLRNFLWRMLFSAVWTAVLIVIFSSCDDFVAVDLPNSQLTTPTVFEDRATANAAMLDVYAKLRDNGLLTGNGGGLSHLLGNYADEFDYYGTSQGGTVAFYNNVLLASNADVKSLWDYSYTQIYGANAVYEGVAASTALTQQDKDQLQGEALFVRALVHFYLTNLYGDVPYITTTSYALNRRAEKVAVHEVYAKVIADLEQAVALLPEAYVGSDRTRPNVYVAYGLLARVYLYAGQWQEASNAASAVLNATDLYSMTAVGDTFLKESGSALWQFAPGFSNGNALEAQTFIFSMGPPPLSALRSELVSAFGNDDLRRTAWIGSVTDGVTTWYHPYKYQNNAGTESTEYSVVFRVAEQYLIRAEARAKSGDLIGAKEDLDVVRQTAGLPPTTAVTQEAILADILEERRLELFSEYGHRFFDLKRNGLLDGTLGGLKPGWNTTDRLLPLPQAELLLNPNLLPQNQGY